MNTKNFVFKNLLNAHKICNTTKQKYNNKEGTNDHEHIFHRYEEETRMR